MVEKIMAMKILVRKAALICLKMPRLAVMGL